MRRLHLIALLLALVSTAAHANKLVNVPYNSPVVQLRCIQGPYTDVGSGTLVGPLLVATCEHVVTNSTEIDVHFATGEVIPGITLARSEANDTALVRLAYPPKGVKPVPLAEAKVGEFARIAGYGGLYEKTQSYTFLSQEGTNFLVNAVDKKKNRVYSIVRGAQARSGDSGGPIFNVRGELVAVLWGSVNDKDGKETYGHDPRKFIKRLVTDAELAPLQKSAYDALRLQADNQRQRPERGERRTIIRYPSGRGPDGRPLN